MNPFELQYVRGQWGYSGITKTGWIRLHAAIGAMTRWLGHWISDLKSTVLKPLGGSKVISAFYHFELDQTNNRNSWGISRKNQISGSVALRPVTL